MKRMLVKHILHLRVSGNQAREKKGIEGAGVTSLSVCLHLTSTLLQETHPKAQELLGSSWLPCAE